MLQRINRIIMENSNKKDFNLALQGGGAHGAFTWGVLDRLLQEENLNIEGITGTSAGAMNAVMLAYGMVTGGREGARETLAAFWQGLTKRNLTKNTSLGMDNLPGVDLSPTFSILRSMGWFLSPYQFNPLAFDPLREIVDELVDFDRLRKENEIKLFIAATQVRTGKIRIFENDEITTDALLASACIPSMHHAVIIDNEPYWDGAFSGNPAIYPLLHNCNSKDIVVVMLAPLEIDDHPRTAESIRDRARDLTFNAAFLREMRAIADVKDRFDKGPFTLGKLERRIRDTNIHLIEAQDLMNDLDQKSKLDTSEAFLTMLFEEGQEHANMWLEQHADFIGKGSSIDMMKLFA